MLRRPPTELAIEVRIPPAEVERRLRSSMRIVGSFLLSPTWGALEHFVGQVERGRFKMRVRHGYSNGLTRLLYGKVIPIQTGGVIAARFETLWWVVLILLVMWCLILVPVALYLRQASRYGASPAVLIAGALGPLVTWFFLMAIEIVARKMGDGDEVKMRQHLKDVFADASVPLK